MMSFIVSRSVATRYCSPFQPVSFSLYFRLSIAPAIVCACAVHCKISVSNKLCKQITHIKSQFVIIIIFFFFAFGFFVSCMFSIVHSRSRVSLISGGNLAWLRHAFYSPNKTNSFEECMWVVDESNCLSDGKINVERIFFSGAAKMCIQCISPYSIIYFGYLLVVSSFFAGKIANYFTSW